MWILNIVLSWPDGPHQQSCWSLVWVFFAEHAHSPTTHPVVRLPDWDWTWQSSLTFPATRRSPPWVFWLTGVVCVIVCVCEGGSERDIEANWQRTESTRLCVWIGWFSQGPDFAHILWQLLGITPRRKAGEQVCNLCHMEMQSSHPASPFNLSLTFQFLSQIGERCGALHQITLSMPFPRQNGPVHPMQLTALALHIWPQDVRINLTASIVGQDGSPLPFDVSSLVCLWNLFTRVWWMLLICDASGWVFETPGAHCAPTPACTHTHTQACQVLKQKPHIKLRFGI